MSHTGKHAMERLPNMVDGIPKLFPKNLLYKYRHCLTGQISKHKSGYTLYLHDINTLCLNFQMDFGFVRGSDYAHMEADNRLIVSIAGYDIYLLIMDEVTRYH